ncbi:MAG: hypothetical protein MHPSP_001255, partial [Paramarteilia canceri]
TELNSSERIYSLITNENLRSFRIVNGEKILKEIFSVKLKIPVLLLAIVVPVIDSPYNLDYILFYNLNNQI